MTVTEILSYMRLRYDAYTSQDAPGYDDADLCALFNKAQKVFCKSLYNELANPTQKGAEESEKRSKDLVQLKAHSTLSNFSTGDQPNSQLVELPNDLWVALKEECDINYTNSCGEAITNYRAPVKPVKEDYYNSNFKNPYKKPYEELIWRIDRERETIASQIDATNNKQHELVLFAGATPVTYRISYYRIPKDIVDPAIDPTTFCEFDYIHHEAIADLAVEFAMQTTDRPGLQSKMMENQKNIE